MTTLYSGGHVFDGNGTLLENHGVLVEDDRITHVAPNAEFEGFTGERVNTSGGPVLPVLIDCPVPLVFGGEADPKPRLAGLGPGTGRASCGEEG